MSTLAPPSAVRYCITNGNYGFAAILACGLARVP